jgi:hypothetical protein
VGLPPSLSWHWKADALVPGADNRDKKREDAPLRVIVAFDGDRSTLPDASRRASKGPGSCSDAIFPMPC